MFTEFFAEKTISGAPIAQDIKIQDPTPTLMFFICEVDVIATFNKP